MSPYNVWIQIIEAIHVHYRCNRCGGRMVEEFKLADVFMYEPPTS